MLVPGLGSHQQGYTWPCIILQSFWVQTLWQKMEKRTAGHRRFLAEKRLADLRKGLCARQKALEDSQRDGLETRPLAAEEESRPLAAKKSETLEEYLRILSKDPSTWKEAAHVIKFIPRACSIRTEFHKRVPGFMMEALSARGQVGSLCTMLLQGDVKQQRSFKGVAITLAARILSHQTALEFLTGALAAHPSVCHGSVKCPKGTSKCIFTTTGNLRLEMALDRMFKKGAPAIGGQSFCVSLRKWSSQETVTREEEAEICNLLCTLTGYRPPCSTEEPGADWEPAIGGRGVKEEPPAQEEEESPVADWDQSDSDESESEEDPGGWVSFQSTIPDLWF